MLVAIFIPLNILIYIRIVGDLGKSKEISDELKKFENPNKNLTAQLLNSTPTEFLNKTHIGNIGTKVFDVTRNYVDISLRLPYRPTYSEV